MEKIFLSDSRNQYLLKVTFNRLVKNFKPASTKLVYKSKIENHRADYNQYLSKFIFCSNPEGSEADNQMSILFSFKEFPHLIIGTIWKEGKIVLAPNEYLEPRKVSVNYSSRKRYTQFSTSNTWNFWNIFPKSLSKMNVFKFWSPDKTTLFVIPVYEVIRAFYCESSSIADSCFNGKAVFHKILTENSRQLFNIGEDEGFVVLSKHIEDDRAGLALRLLENENYYTQFCNVFQTIIDKDNNGPLIFFPADWKTEMTHYAMNLDSNVVFINYISYYTDFKSKYTSAQFGRVNDGRKGENSESDDLTKTKGGKRAKVEGSIDGLPIVDNVKTDNELELANLHSDLVNKTESKIEIRKVDKTIQFYTNDKDGITYVDGTIVAITTDVDYVDGSQAGGLHLNGDSQYLNSNFQDTIAVLKNMIDKTFKVDSTILKFKNDYYKFVTDQSKDADNIFRWCFMTKVKGKYLKDNRRIGICTFEYRNRYCYIFEIEKRKTGNAIGIVVTKLDLRDKKYKAKIGNLMQAIKTEEGQLENIAENKISDLLIKSQRHRTDEDELCALLKGKVDKLIKIGP